MFVRGSGEEDVVGVEVVGLDGLTQMGDGEAHGTAGAEFLTVARDTAKPMTGDEDEGVEVVAEGAQEGVGRSGADGDEGDGPRAGGEGFEGGESRRPGGRASEQGEEARVVEAVEVDVARAGDESEEAPVHARVSSAARRT